MKISHTPYRFPRLPINRVRHSKKSADMEPPIDEFRQIPIALREASWQKGLEYWELQNCRLNRRLPGLGIGSLWGISLVLFAQEPPGENPFIDLEAMYFSEIPCNNSGGIMIARDVLLPAIENFYSSVRNRSDRKYSTKSSSNTDLGLIYALGRFSLAHAQHALNLMGRLAMFTELLITDSSTYDEMKQIAHLAEAARKPALTILGTAESLHRKIKFPKL